ncbi:uncharacterized protein Bfra_010148 [Botrytis fragariae]|uniref:Uncharacterized protein n=1 Tax=Botrytis fragariae TaxID=1964551 RepID=A0A8H6EF58_9HELO|nr:uncharacterized protein Bfra_010148 [Botrytis fragariae]KAF5870002.1 hypothetical protein Bfra_010148 [Botrytis fragariae]
MEHGLRLHQDHIKILETKRWDIEKFEKQLAHSESLIEEYNSSNEQVERRQLQQYKRETEASNEKTALGRIAKELRSITSLIDGPDVPNKRSGSNDFQINDLVHSDKIVMMRFEAVEEKNEMHVSKIVELERRNERLQSELRNRSARAMTGGQILDRSDPMEPTKTVLA